jgi:hypothetical protein
MNASDTDKRLLELKIKYKSLYPSEWHEKSHNMKEIYEHLDLINEIKELENPSKKITDEEILRVSEYCKRF